MKKIIGFLAACAILLTPVMAHASTIDETTQNKDVKLVIDEKTIYSDETQGMPYINAAGRTMVPLRIISETTGFGVFYTENTVFIEKASMNYKAIFKVGESQYYLNNKATPMDTPTTVSAFGRAYVPLRALAETYGTVHWDEKTRTVTVNRNKPSTAEDKGWFPLAGTNDAFELQKSTTATILRHNLQTGSAQRLAFPAEYAERFVTTGTAALYIQAAKTINGDVYIGMVSESGQRTGGEPFMDVFKVVGNQLIFIGNGPSTSDFTTDGTYFFSTFGSHQGGFMVEPRVLYVTDVGEKAPSTFRKLTLNFDVNNATLRVQDGKLIATGPEDVVNEVALTELGLHPKPSVPVVNPPEDAKNLPTRSVPGSDSYYMLAPGATADTKDALFVFWHNSKDNTNQYLALPVGVHMYLNTQALNEGLLHIDRLKRAENANHIGILDEDASTYEPTRSTYEERIAIVFRHADPQTGPLEYAGHYIQTSDFAANDNWFFATEGLPRRLAEVDPTALHIYKIGNPEIYKTLHLNFEVNKSNLTANNTQLQIVEPNGKTHTLILSDILP